MNVCVAAFCLRLYYECTFIQKDTNLTSLLLIGDRKRVASMLRFVIVIFSFCLLHDKLTWVFICFLGGVIV